MNDVDTLVGIDPGINGVIAHLSARGVLLSVHKMPVRLEALTSRADGEARRVCIGSLVDLFARLRPSYAVLEQVSSMSGDTPMTAFSFGWSYGSVVNALALHARSHPEFAGVIKAPPSVWKGDLGLSADKKLSKPRALKLFPASRDLITSVDKAEAAMIGLWGKLSGKTPAPL